MDSLKSESKDFLLHQCTNSLDSGMGSMSMDSLTSSDCKSHTEDLQKPARDGGYNTAPYGSMSVAPRMKYNVLTSAGNSECDSDFSSSSFSSSMESTTSSNLPIADTNFDSASQSNSMGAATRMKYNGLTSAGNSEYDSGFSSSSFPSSMESTTSSSLPTADTHFDSASQSNSMSAAARMKYNGLTSAGNSEYDSGFSSSSFSSSMESTTSSSLPTADTNFDNASQSNSMSKNNEETKHNNLTRSGEPDSGFDEPRSKEAGSGSVNLNVQSLLSNSSSLSGEVDFSRPSKSSSSTGSSGCSVSSNTTKPTNHFEGSAHDFLKELSQKYWTKWDPVADIKDRLNPALLAEIRVLLWKQDAEGDFEALNAAFDKDESVVALAVFVARNHKLLNTMNKERQTILHVAAELCSYKLVRLIVTRGADGAIPDVWGDTPLHIASREGRADVIKALTTTLTKPEVRHPYYRVPYKSLPQDNVQSYNHDGRAPVHLASQVPHSKEHHEALRMLAKSARADLDYRRLGDGYSPSHIAIDNGDKECLTICLEMGADSEVRNFKSETPQQLAFLCHSQSMVDLCQNYGAGKYQLDYAETEPVCSDDDMETDELEMYGACGGLSHEMQKMIVN